MLQGQQKDVGPRFLGKLGKSTPNSWNPFLHFCLPFERVPWPGPLNELLMSLPCEATDILRLNPVLSLTFGIWEMHPGETRGRWLHRPWGRYQRTGMFNHSEIYDHSLKINGFALKGTFPGNIHSNEKERKADARECRAQWQMHHFAGGTNWYFTANAPMESVAIPCWAV